MQTQDWLDRTSDGLFVIQNLRALALVALARGDVADAEARLRAAYPFALQNGGYLAVEVSRPADRDAAPHAAAEEARSVARSLWQTCPRRTSTQMAASKRIEAELAAADGDADGMRAGYIGRSGAAGDLQAWLDLGETHIEFSVSLRAVGDH